MSTERSRKKARERAIREYEEGWNLRPAKGVVPALRDALVGEAAALRWVKWVTMAESREDEGGPVTLLVGVRVDPAGPLTFAQVEARLQERLREVEVPTGTVRFAELDDDVDPTMAAGGANPYLVYARPP